MQTFISWWEHLEIKAGEGDLAACAPREVYAPAAQGGPEVSLPCQQSPVGYFAAGHRARKSSLLEAHLAQLWDDCV